MSADGLQSALAALDSYWSGRDPTWSKRLPPGLTQREIQDAEAAIHPMVLSDELVEKAVQTIIASARTGKIGDGKIFLSRIDEAIRIRNEERGVAAL